MVGYEAQNDFDIVFHSERQELDRGHPRMGGDCRPEIRTAEEGTTETANGRFDWSLLRNGDKWAVFQGTNCYSSSLSVDVDKWQHVAAVFERPPTVVRFMPWASVKSVFSRGLDIGPIIWPHGSQHSMASSR